MGVRLITAWLCDFPTCGHVWYTAKEPLRCAKCKRKNWNKTGGDVIKAPKTRKKRAPAKPSVQERHGLNCWCSECHPESAQAEVVPVTPLETTAAGWEKPLPPVLETIVHAPVAERFQEALKQIAEPDHKIGERCKHGWANWLQCEKCNPKVAQ